MEKRSNTLESINALASQAPQTLVRRSEEQFDRRLREITTRIAGEDGREIVMLAGPSASGKTTTAGKIAEKCMSRGMRTHVVSLDDFYLNRDQIPMDENGVRDFETVYALDLPLFTETMHSLLSGWETALPQFDFTVGKRSETVRRVSLGAQDCVVVEGLHALNPVITDALPQKNLLKIYISVSTRIYNAKGDVVLGKRSLRLLRRMMRDYQFRASSVENTYALWENVRVGEDKYLFPFCALADVRLNSAHLSAPCVFRDMALPLLEAANLHGAQQAHAQGLIAALRQFVPISASEIPADSLLREFLGTAGLAEND